MNARRRPLESNDTLPPGVESMLSRLAGPLPGPARDAAHWLRRALAPIAGSVWPEAAWRFSRLTCTGFPVEFAWSSRETAVRWTADVASPESSEHGRLEIAAACVPGGDGIDLAPWLRLQRGARLRYGAWLGMRHADGTVGKLYAELPATTALPDAHRHPLLRADGLAWRMVGLNVDGSREYYGRGLALDLAAVTSLADVVSGGEGGHLRERLRAITRGQELPRPSGISLTLGADGTPLAITWFTFAKAVFRDDAEATALLRTLGEDASRDVYDALAAGDDDGAWRHGMVGAGIDARGSAWLQCGLRPT